MRELRFNVGVSTVWDERYEAEDHRDLAKLVACPALIITGEHDFICGPTWNRVLAEAIPGARYVEMANVGHMPQYEDPEQLMAIVGSWLAEG